MSDKKIPVEHYNTKSNLEDVESRWWTLDEKDIHKHIFSIVKDIENRQSYRKVQNLRHARLYSNREILGLQAGMFSRTANDALQNNNVTLNVVASCVDTAASKIAKAKPRPMALTIGGDWSLQEKAKKLTKYLDGAISQMKLYEHMQRSFIDSGIFGTGEVKFFKEDGRVKCERVIIDEIIIDDADAIYGNPFQRHQTKYMSKDVLAEMFPKHADKILAAQSGLPPEIQSKYALDVVKVIESWKLPSAKGAGDGLHSISIENATLFSKKYTRSRFPFVTQRWKQKITGFFGMGIAEELLGIQLAINKRLYTVDRAQDLMCVPRIWVENNSMVNTGHINNDIGAIGKYTGTPPQISTWPAMPPEVYQWIESLYAKAYEIIGISQLSATSRKPDGLDSGTALRTYQDVESDRFQLVAQRYEEDHMEAADLIVELTRELAAEGKDPYVTVKDGKEVQVLRWKDVDLKEDPYELRIFPTSLLPTQPAGKLQTVQELVQAGFIEKDMAMSLLDFPDFDAALSNMLSSYNLIKKMLFTMIDKGEYQSPEPFMKLPQALTMAQNYYLQCRYDDVPEPKLELIRRFMSDVQALMEQAQPPQPQQGMMPPQMGMDQPPSPQAVPVAPPQSDLLPNAPQGVM
jgi:hypothetical protein